MAFKSVIFKPPHSTSVQSTLLLTFSDALLLQSFFCHKNLNSGLLILIKLFHGTTSAYILYIKLDMRKVLIIHIFPTMLEFLFSQPILVFY